MPNSIFISLTHRDTEIAKTLRAAIRDIFGDLFSINFSTSKEIEGGIRGGQDWFQWIVDQVKTCDVAFVLMTPNSVQKPWIMWESGAVYGAALATGEEGLNKVRPLVYQLRSDDIPSPIKDSKTQYLYGDKREDISQLMKELLDEFHGQLNADARFNAYNNVDNAVSTYLEKINEALLNAPALPSGNVIEEWRHRLDDIVEQNRMSEVAQLNRWMDITFGLEEKEPQALDLRIHARLGEIYLKAGETKKAIGQLRLAQRLAPRDIYVLRKLGQSLLNDKDYDGAGNVIGRVEELDPEAMTHNAECAALKGRWYREKDQRMEEAAIYEKALQYNHSSYYLANLAAEAYLASGEIEKSRQRFQQSLKIIDKLGEKNVWSLATQINACIVLDDFDRAKELSGELKALAPTMGERKTIQGGLLRIADSLGGRQKIEDLLAAL